MKTRTSISMVKGRLLRAAKAVCSGRNHYSCYAVLVSCGSRVYEMYAEAMMRPDTPALQAHSVEMASDEIGVSPRKFRTMLILMFREAIADL